MSQGDKLDNELLAAVTEQPIVSRLEIVRDILFKRYGSVHCIPPGGRTRPEDPVLEAAVDILDGVIEVVRRNPQAAKLRAPEP